MRDKFDNMILSSILLFFLILGEIWITMWEDESVRSCDQELLHYYHGIQTSKKVTSYNTESQRDVET